MSGILVVAELTAQGGLHKLSLETLAAAQAMDAPVSAVVFGQNAGEAAARLARYRLEKVFALDHELLAQYTADGATAALDWLIERVQPELVLFPHTYQARDYAPKLATRRGRVLVSDVIAIQKQAQAIVLRRQLFQGKLAGDYRPAPGMVFASLQAGAWRADALIPGETPIETLTPELAAAEIRQQPEAPFRESSREVDLSAAPLIVAVGRGIKEESNLELARELAGVLGAELAASRPVCDNGWLPMERQVGSSGQTVAPKLYLALGISGAIQHLVGMKGSQCIVAINKDPDAPIFEVADYGIVGDLFEVVPALIAEAAKAKS
ncbi:MAG: electron transfer flavoprotein subunit alpha/FixB family protein [Bryobacteraceae bacterium]|nr:electron transfer flavoprotein subunit alpha/FixB family protein [Solibacteraceae bacterium]MCL4793420.1 electron transfer flavoprotein subunit alpha/FixB family protein [Bryobacteraceae bacterium]